MERDGIWMARHPDVYEPAEDTFLLARAVADHIRTRGEPTRMLEVGCGAGLVAIAAARAGASVTAIDINAHAVRLTAHNAAQNKVLVSAAQGDLMTALRGGFDVIAFNPPYLPTASDEHVSGPLDAAFDGGPDGSQVAVRFADQLAAWTEDARPEHVFIVHSSLADPAPFSSRMDGLGYRVDVVAADKHFFEEVQVRRFRRRD